MKQTALLKSQRDLIAIRIAQAQAAQNEAQNAVNNAAVELGLKIEDKWTLSKDLMFFEKQEKAT